MVFVLENDPNDLINLSKNALKEVLRKPGKFCRPLPLNKNSVVLDYSYSMNLDVYKTLGLEKIKERAKVIHDNKKFGNNVSQALGELAREKKKNQKIRMRKI